jgi:hypothetical protein
LNKGSKSEQPTRPVNLRDDGVDIDLPSREEIEGELKYLKNNKATGADSIARALEIRAWTSDTLPRNCTDGVLCSVYKKGDKLYCKNYRGICLLNVTYKVFAKILYNRFLPYANAAVTRLDSNPANQKQTNSLHCAKS